MAKWLHICILLLCCVSLAEGQARLSQTLQSYNEAQKRLLARNIGRFLFMVYQGQWDLDSSVQYACKIYGFNRQFPYDEMIYDTGIREEVQWLNQRQVAAVINAAGSATGEKKIRLLLELAIYYLHQPGTYTGHLDSAASFIAAARKTAFDTKLTKWQLECDALQGERLFQQGDQPASDRLFAAVVNSFKQEDRSKRKAMVWHQWALNVPFNDPNRIKYLEKAFDQYQQLGLKEHAIEVMSDIVTAYFIFDWSTAEKKLYEVLALEKAAGYRHVMDTYYVISYLKGTTSDYIGAVNYNDSCVASMTATGDSMLYSLVCSRMGYVYYYLGDGDRAYTWYRKGMERKDLEPQLFWYKNFLYLPRSSNAYDNNPKETLGWIKDILARYPPQGRLDSMEVMCNYGLLYEALGQPREAEAYYLRILEDIGQYPREHTHGIRIDYQYFAGDFYFNQKKYARARTLLEMCLQLSKGKEFPRNLKECYLLLSKLDSIAGNYQGALANYKQYKLFADSSFSISQRFKSQEFNVIYETAKKDKDIQLLQQEGLLQDAALQRAEQTRNIVIAGLALLALIMALLYNQYRIKRKSALLIEQKNKALEQLVDEKEWLLKEVHHRVKNSLQTVVSLLELQTGNLRGDPLSAIQSSQNRIFATSLLHQKLYQTDNRSSVNMNMYLPELVYYLQEAFNTRNSIHFEINIQSIELDISQAVSIGIIINEVITNAIKHAFPGDTGHNEIRVSMAMIEGDTAELLIADNGKGIPIKAHPVQEEGLGLKLVRGLTEDIDGEVQIISGAGTIVFIRFKPRPSLTRNYDRQQPGKAVI